VHSARDTKSRFLEGREKKVGGKKLKKRFREGRGIKDRKIEKETKTKKKTKKKKSERKDRLKGTDLTIRKQ